MQSTAANPQVIYTSSVQTQPQAKPLGKGMIKNTEAAKMLYIALLEASHDLSDAMVQIWDLLDEDERVRCKKAVARMIAEIYFDGIASIEQMHSGFSKSKHANHGARVGTKASPARGSAAPLLTRLARPNHIPAANQCGRCAKCAQSRSTVLDASPFLLEQQPDTTPRL